MSTLASRLSLRGRMPALRLTSGITAIIVKELRGRMRGRRAFIVVTLHVLLLTAFAWMFQRINEEIDRRHVVVRRPGDLRVGIGRVAGSSSGCCCSRP